MSEIQITKKEARQFILLKQGLLGDYRFEGKQGVLKYVRIQKYGNTFRKYIDNLNFQEYNVYK